MCPAVLFLLVARVQHLATQDLGVVDRLWQEALSTDGLVSVSARISRARTEVVSETTHLSSLATSPTVPHFSRSPSRYSLRACSRLSMTPSFSAARAFQMRKLESSEPDKTNRESSVYSEQNTLRNVIEPHQDRGFWLCDPVPLTAAYVSCGRCPVPCPHPPSTVEPCGRNCPRRIPSLSVPNRMT